MEARDRRSVARWLRRPRLGSLRRTSPISDHWGADRGTPVDRYYIEHFLALNSADIRGRVLEVMDARYTERFGTGVEASDVLDIDATNPLATVVADLTSADTLPAEAHDSFLLVQTLQSIYDVPEAIAGAHRLLRPAGVLLATVPAVSKIDPTPGVHGDYWRFTTASCRRVFGDVFGAANVSVRSYGNVLAAIAFLAGLAREDVTDQELDVQDDFFPVVITVRAVKASTP